MANAFTKRREPFTFMLWLSILGSAILFSFILFVFVKKEFANTDIPVKVPISFWFSTFAIVGSSLTLIRGKSSLLAEKFEEFRWMIALSYVLGLIFLMSQLLGWTQLLRSGVTMANSTGGSFTYILSGLHIFHTLGGVVALTFVIRDAFRKTSYVDSFVYSVNPPNQLRLKLVSLYWHFLDVVWLAIFLFLLYHASQN